VFQNANMFDHCLLNNVKLYLNFDFYLYDLNLDFDKNRYAVLFDIYARFRKSYYGYKTSNITRPVLDHYVLVSGGGVRVSDVTHGEGV